MKGDQGIINLILKACMISNTKQVKIYKHKKWCTGIIQEQNAIGWNQVLHRRLRKLIVQNHDM